MKKLVTLGLFIPVLSFAQTAPDGTDLSNLLFYQQYTVETKQFRSYDPSVDIHDVSPIYLPYTQPSTTTQTSGTAVGTSGNLTQTGVYINATVPGLEFEQPHHFVFDGYNCIGYNANNKILVVEPINLPNSASGKSYISSTINGLKYPDIQPFQVDDNRITRYTEQGYDHFIEGDYHIFSNGQSEIVFNATNKSVQRKEFDSGGNELWYSIVFYKEFSPGRFDKWAERELVNGMDEEEKPFKTVISKVYSNYYRFEDPKFKDLELEPLSELLILYPNPVDDYFQIEHKYNADFKYTQVRLVSMLDGQVAFQTSGTFDAQSQINISELPAGIYALTITTTKNQTAQLELQKH